MGLPRVLKRFALFMDGVSYVGEVPEVTLPKLTRKTEDYQSGGMGGPVKIDLGSEGLELEWTAAGYVKDLYQGWGALKHDAILLRFAGGLQADDSEEIQSLEVTVRGRHQEIDHGSAKAGDKTEIKIKTALSYYKLSIDGQVLVELDYVNMIEVINGEDRMAAWRAALGI